MYMYTYIYLCVCVYVCMYVSYPWNIGMLWKSPLQILMQICGDLYRTLFNPSTIFIYIGKWIFFRKIIQEYVCLCFSIRIFTSSWYLTLRHRKFKFLLLTLRKYFSWSLGCHSKFWFKNIFILYIISINNFCMCHCNKIGSLLISIKLFKITYCLDLNDLVHEKFKISRWMPHLSLYSINIY